MSELVQLNEPTLRKPPMFDVALAVGLAVVCSGISSRLAESHDVAALGRGPWMYVGVAATCLPLAFRRVHPLIALGGSVIGLGIYLVVGSPGGPTYAIPLVAVYSVGYYVRRPPLWVSVVASSVVVLTAELVGRTETDQWQVFAFWPLWILAAMFVGLGGRNRHQQLADEKARVREWEEAQQAAAQRQVAEERLRIARDIHDVVAHSLASITVLAGAGTRVAESDPAAARRVLEDIRKVSVDALGEVRTTIGDLRSGSSTVAEPQSDLGGLMAQMSAAGLTVTADVSVDLAEIDDSTRIAVYRIIQESLTNVLRHSGSSEAELKVEAKGGGLSLVVRDHGRGRIAASTNGVPVDGHGLIGMRERVRAAGGIIDAADHPDGGFCVTAWIPTAGPRTADPGTADPGTADPGTADRVKDPSTERRPAVEESAR